MKNNARPRAAVSAQEKTEAAIGKHVNALKPHLPNEHDLGWDAATIDNIKIGTVVSLLHSGERRYGIVCKRTEGDGEVCGFRAISNSGVYASRHDVVCGSFWWRQLRVVPSEIAAVAVAAVKKDTSTEKKRIDRKASAVLLPHAPMPEANLPPVRIPVSGEVRHVAMMPKSLAEDIAAIRAKQEALASEQVKLWSDYLEHAERVEKQLAENTAAINALLQALTPCDSKGLS